MKKDHKLYLSLGAIALSAIELLSIASIPYAEMIQIGLILATIIM